MRCYCCGIEIALARMVMLRSYVKDPWGPLGSAAFLSWLEEMRYRWTVICSECYWRFNDSQVGLAAIGGKLFNMACNYRAGKATVVNAEDYQEFQRQEAAKLGLDL